jgi:hypothetical protein
MVGKRSHKPGTAGSIPLTATKTMTYELVSTEPIWFLYGYLYEVLEVETGEHVLM